MEYIMQKIKILAIAVIFVESKYILFKNMIYTIKKYFFAYLLIIKKERDAIKKIVLSIYKDNI